MLLGERSLTLSWNKAILITFISRLYNLIYSHALQQISMIRYMAFLCTHHDTVIFKTSVVVVYLLFHTLFILCELIWRIILSVLFARWKDRIGNVVALITFLGFDLLEERFDRFPLGRSLVYLPIITIEITLRPIFISTLLQNKIFIRTYIVKRIMIGLTWQNWQLVCLEKFRFWFHKYSTKYIKKPKNTQIS